MIFKSSKTDTPKNSKHCFSQSLINGAIRCRPKSVKKTTKHTLKMYDSKIVSPIELDKNLGEITRNVHFHIVICKNVHFTKMIKNALIINFQFHSREFFLHNLKLCWPVKTWHITYLTYSKNVNMSNHNKCYFCKDWFLLFMYHF